MALQFGPREPLHPPPKLALTRSLHASTNFTMLTTAVHAGVSSVLFFRERKAMLVLKVMKEKLETLAMM